ERIHVLYEQACARFKTMGLTNIQARFSDGYAGWPEVAPFAGIIATAAAPEVPPALLAQLAIGGRLIIPVGDQGVQQLKLIIRINENEYKTEIIEAVVFVPLLKGTDE